MTGPVAVPVRTSGSDLLDVDAAARYLAVTPRFVRSLVQERRVRYFKVGKFVRFAPVDLEEFLQSGRQDPWVR
jgi:excisionase family DNA binding protein